MHLASRLREAHQGARRQPGNGEEKTRGPVRPLVIVVWPCVFGTSRRMGDLSPRSAQRLTLILVPEHAVMHASRPGTTRGMVGASE